MNKLILWLLLGINLLTSSACALYDYSAKAVAIANRAGLEREVVKAGKFELLTYYRIEDKKQPINVYIEGDGHAYSSHGFVSANPSPHNPVALKLASLDSSANVIYIARPYQFVDFDEDYKAVSKYWTSHRYSEDVVSAFNEVLDTYSQNTMNVKYRLIGFSGGGTIACLLAAQRKDTIKLITVAGNLDVDLHSKLHEVPVLVDSLNPIDFIEELKNTVQIHYSGSEDTVVPRQIAESYLEALAVGVSVAKHEIVEGNTHAKGWESFWSKSHAFKFD